MRVKAVEPIAPTEASKLKVCAYARVSTESESQGRSLENQETHYRNLIMNNPRYQFVGVYTDQGISGYSEKRSGFQKMLRKARAGNIDLIITKSILRFARNTVTILKFVRELKGIGVGIFLKSKISTHCLTMVNCYSPQWQLLQKKKAKT